jgi:hypothetical protein
MQLGISRSQSFEAQWRNLDFHRSFYRIFDALPRSEVKQAFALRCNAQAILSEIDLPDQAGFF